MFQRGASSPENSRKPLKVSWSQPQKLLRFFCYGGVTVLAILLLTSMAAILIVNTHYGRQYVEKQVLNLTGGMVKIKGLSGRFPVKIALAHLDLKDAQGIWFTADHVTLRWHPLALLHLRVKIDDLSAHALSVPRLPVADETTPAPTTETASPPGYLHLAIQLRRLDVEKFEIGAPVVGTDASLSVRGHMRLSNLAHILSGLDLKHLSKIQLGLEMARLDQIGSLKFDLDNATRQLRLHLAVKDPSNALLAHVITQPRNVPLMLNLDAEGPRNRVAARIDLKIGDDRVAGQGVINIPAQKADLNLEARTGAMQFVGDAGWQSLYGNFKLRGPFLSPSGEGRLTIDRLTSAAAQASRIDMAFMSPTMAGKPKTLSLQTRIDRLKLSALPSDPFIADPVTIEATYLPEEKHRPAQFHLSHRIIKIDGDVYSSPDFSGNVTYKLSDLAPWAAAGAVEMKGHVEGQARIRIPTSPGGKVELTDDTEISVSEAPESWRGMVRGLTKLHISAAQAGSPGKLVYELKDLSVSNPHLNIRASGFGGLQPGQNLQMGLKLGLPKLTDAAPNLRGHADLTASIHGKIDDFSLTTELRSAIGIDKAADGQLALSASFANLPSRPSGFIQASGLLDSAPLNLSSQLTSDKEGGHRFKLERLTWRGVDGLADLRLGPHKIFPVGSARLTISDLNQFSSLVGKILTGHIAFKASTQEATMKQPERMDASLDGRIATPDVQINRLKLDASVTDPETKPDLTARLKIEGIQTAFMSGRAAANLRGPQDDLRLDFQSHLSPFFGADLTLASETIANMTKKEARVTKLNARLKDDSLRLTKPMLVTWGERTGIAPIAIALSKPGVTPASLSGYAFISPQLSLQMALKNVRPAFASPFVPSLDIDGVFSATAQLTGSISAPHGRVMLMADRLRALSGDASALPQAMFKAMGDLKGDHVQLQANARAGDHLNISLQGSAPLNMAGRFNLATRGRIDLRIANAITGANGMTVQGQIAPDLQFHGTMQKPEISGKVALENVAFSDYAQGLSVSDIHGAIISAGDQLILRDITGRAGAGNIKLGGSIGVLRPGIPIDLTFNARKARPVSSELITAVIDASLRANGNISEKLNLSGKVKLDTVTVNIPDSVPASIPKLDVVWPNQKVTRSKAQGDQGMAINLNLQVASPGSFYVRGHGLDAEMMGMLRINGTAASPNIEGSFDMRRGYFNLAGVNLNFSHGVVGFNGSGVEHQLDPSLDFRADRNVQGTTASLVVSGYASAPKIDFISAPSFPRDQVLAMLLFGSMTPQLTTAQMASLATALAQVAGGGGGFDPLIKIRGLLGLDRLAVGGGGGVADGGASVEAGKYITKGVYVGAKQATSGSGTQAQVQVDLTKRLKLNTTVGTGGQITGFTTPENDPGSSVGLSYGLDY